MTTVVDPGNDFVLEIDLSDDTRDAGPASLDADRASDGASSDAFVPDPGFVECWTRRALEGLGGRDAGTLVELSLHLVDEATSRALNRDLRGRDHPTNVLSFPSGLPVLVGAEAGQDGDGCRARLVLGELVMCPAVVTREAAEQDKPVEAHWAHLVVHGVLHLAGLDHDTEERAERMESLEIRLLSGSGLPDPYRVPVDLSDE